MRTKSTVISSLVGQFSCENCPIKNAGLKILSLDPEVLEGSLSMG